MSRSPLLRIVFRGHETSSSFPLPVTSLAVRGCFCSGVIQVRLPRHLRHQERNREDDRADEEPHNAECLSGPKQRVFLDRSNHWLSGSVRARRDNTGHRRTFGESLCELVREAEGSPQHPPRDFHQSTVGLEGLTPLFSTIEDFEYWSKLIKQVFLQALAHFVSNVAQTSKDPPVMIYLTRCVGMCAGGSICFGRFS